MNALANIIAGALLGSLCAFLTLNAIDALVFSQVHGRDHRP